MATLSYDKDIDDSILRDKTIAVLGYGSQGHAHALNLKESGFNVVVGLYEGSRSKQTAEEAGLKVLSNADATKAADLISFCLPDTVQSKVYREDVQPNLAPGKTLLFAHGFTIFYEQITPPPDIDVVMIAPKAPGHRVRAVYERGLGVPCLVAVHQDVSGAAHDLALAYGKGIGGGRAGILETTFKEETETDLFGEQVVLCGGLTALITAGFETLVEAGYAPEMAYFECLHEVKLIVDLIYEVGIANMRYSISNTAEYGDHSRGPRIVNDAVRDEMKKILEDIQSGKFTREWVLECGANQPSFKAMRRRAAEHPIEKVGEQLRSMMPWIGEQALVDRSKN